MLFRISGLAALTAATLHGALVRVEVKERAPVPGTVYERMIGRAYFTVDPSLPVNRAVVDLDKAPRNATGQVEFSGDLYILKPKAEAANGSILYAVRPPPSPDAPARRADSRQPPNFLRPLTPPCRRGRIYRRG